MKPWEGSPLPAFERRGARTVPARNHHHEPIPAQSPSPILPPFDIAAASGSG